MKRIKDHSGVVHLQASWVPSPIVIDGNFRHLVVYLSYPDEEEFSDQLFYRVFLCGSQSYANRVQKGNDFIDAVKNELTNNHIEVEKIVRGVGLT